MLLWTRHSLQNVSADNNNDTQRVHVCIEANDFAALYFLPTCTCREKRRLLANDLGREATDRSEPLL
jgi:hypothetical protein